MRITRARGAGFTVFLATSLGAVGLASTALPVAAQTLNFARVWSQTLSDTGQPIALSSPNEATLGGVPAVVVGDRAGHIYAFSLAGGTAVPGWPASTGGIPVDSTPSVAALSKGSPDDTVFVGVGNSSTPHEGGYEAFKPDGTRLWYVAVRNPASDHAAPGTSAVRASLAVGDLQGSVDVVAPSTGQEEYAINAATGATLPGFPWFTADSGFSTPALADLYGDADTDIVDGGDQTAGLAYGVQYTQGGHLRVIAPTGTGRTGSPTGGLQCEYNPNQVVESSPAVGPFLGGGAVGITIGTGTYWSGASGTDQLLSFGTHCQLAWEARLDGNTESSPALADVEGNGTLAVIEGTDNGNGGGSVYALAGPTGSVLWHQQVNGEVIGSVVTADFGEGYQDVVVPTTAGTQILDGKTGQVVTTLEQSLGLQSSPLVTDDPDGTIGITVAGYNGHNQGEIQHYELVGSSGAAVDGAGSWPMFHHDPQLTGNAGGPVSGGAAPSSQPVPGSGRCSRPVEGPNGYYEVGRGGEVFTYGNLAVCGSLAGRQLAGPVIGIAATPDGGGYWLADKDGQVFTFGDATSYRSSERLLPAAPIAAIARTPDGDGYWLVAEDGQVLAFGDAKLYRPADKFPSAKAITAMASTPDGRGYWLVAGNGATFAFGDAAAPNPSATLPSTSVVGIAADPTAKGYWLVNADGAVYSFGASSLGSVPTQASEHGIAGIEAEPGGAGYRLVDSGGALFCFGDATNLGSARTEHIESPISGISAP